MRRAAIILLVFSLCFHAIHAAAGDRSRVRKMKVRITSPKPGGSVSGFVPITWEITDNGRPDEEPPAVFYTITYYVDNQYAGISRSSDPPFALDTTAFNDGKHLLTINVIDDKNRVGTTSIWIKVVNEQ